MDWWRPRTQCVANKPNLAVVAATSRLRGPQVRFVVAAYAYPWPDGNEFRILSIDGGGIRGIFPAAFLAGLEKQWLDGKSVAGCFDLIAGTSTGGIIALGLASGYTAADICRLYVERGCEIFPPIPNNWIGDLRRDSRRIFQLFKVRYDRKALVRILRELFGSRKFGDTVTRLCIPSFDGRHGEPYIFKTPHHPDYRLDREESAVKVAAATAAAPPPRPLRPTMLLWTMVATSSSTAACGPTIPS